MSFQCVKDIRRWADEDIESVGRDVLRRDAHRLADAVSDTIETLCQHYDARIAKLVGGLAETPDYQVRLRQEAEYSVRLRREYETLRRMIGLDRCGDCIKCEDELDANCPFAGEPNGCNYLECREAFKALKRSEARND